MNINIANFRAGPNSTQHIIKWKIWTLRDPTREWTEPTSIYVWKSASGRCCSH